MEKRLSHGGLYGSLPSIAHCPLWHTIPYAPEPARLLSGLRVIFSYYAVSWRGHRVLNMSPQLLSESDALTGYSDRLVEGGVWIQKCVSLETLRLGTEACEIDELLDVETDQDIVIQKTQAYAFFGTPFAALLASHGCDSLLVAGSTTSGCVRATVVDAVAHGYPTFVASDSVELLDRLSQSTKY